MRNSRLLALALAALLALGAAPLAARHKHGPGCGHVYSRSHGGWIAVSSAGRYGGFFFGGYGSPRYDHRHSHYEPDHHHHKRKRYKRRYRYDYDYRPSYRYSRPYSAYGAYCPY